MKEEFRKYIEANNLIRKGDSILLAVSGGIDSMVMTNLFQRTDIKYGIAHCNFCLRGKESDKDEKLVRELAARNKVPFFTKRFDTRQYSELKGISIQMAARDLRYKWFEEIRRKNGFDFIAVAHNMNDNIETMLINLTRGTGLTGLSGMKPINDRIIRPLLFATRDKISGYCDEAGVVYREDQSNSETKYTRNKIRHKVIPVLKEINPSVELTLTETAGIMSDADDILNRYITLLSDSLFTKRKEELSADISKLKPYAGNRTIIYELFRPFGITGTGLDNLLRLMNGRTGGQIFTGSYRIIRNRKEIIIAKSGMSDRDFFLINDLDDLINLPFISSVKVRNLTKRFTISTDSSVASLDLDKISFPLTVRNWLKGDLFYPFGMKGSKKLSDYFTDRKYSRIYKEKILILESSGKIVWIIGERIDNRFRITGTTKKALVIKSAGHPVI